MHAFMFVCMTVWMCVHSHSFATGAEDGYIRLTHFDAPFLKALKEGEDE
jgi:hypothetical protein